MKSYDNIKPYIAGTDWKLGKVFSSRGCYYHKRNTKAYHSIQQFYKKPVDFETMIDKIKPDYYDKLLKTSEEQLSPIYKVKEKKKRKD